MPNHLTHQKTGPAGAKEFSKGWNFSSGRSVIYQERPGAESSIGERERPEQYSVDHQEEEKCSG
jgi:hypothetical protein